MMDVIKQGQDYQRIIQVATLVFADARLMFGNEEGWQNRDGAYFCVSRAKTGIPVLLAELGAPSQDKVAQYIKNSQEKPARLALHPGHLTSSESRNIELSQYGGAIRANDDYSLSLSGQPELGDEGIVMTISELLGLTNLTTLQIMAGRTGQTYWQRLRKAQGL